MLNIDLSAKENALLISALTIKIDRLKEQASLFKSQGMHQWGNEAIDEVEACLALKERLFK